MTTPACSLWLMPTGELTTRINATIQRLAHTYASPLFPAHLTLVGPIAQSADEINQKARQLAQAQPAFTVTLDSIDYQDFYYRALFIKAQKVPALLDLYASTTSLFGLTSDTEYMPHISLLYGNFTPEIKQQIISTLEDLRGASFIVDSIHTYVTEGEASSWRSLGEFRLARA